MRNSPFITSNVLSSTFHVYDFRLIFVHILVRDVHQRHQRTAAVFIGKNIPPLFADRYIQCTIFPCRKAIVNKQDIVSEQRIQRAMLKDALDGRIYFIITNRRTTSFYMASIENRRAFINKRIVYIRINIRGEPLCC